MILSFRRLFAPTFTLLALSLATSAQASFSVTTSIASVSFSQSPSFTGGTANPTVTTNGLTIMFNDFNASGRTTTSSPNEQLTFSGAYTGIAETFTITENISITNNGVTGPIPFVELVSGTIDSTNGYQVTSVSVSPSSQIINGTQFSSSQAQATSNDFSDPTNLTAGISARITATAVVPEPASVVLMGLGLIGTAGVAARRRHARA